MFVTSQGSPYTRFRRALTTGTVTLSEVRAATEAFERMAQRPEDALATLQRLCT
jgi:hypothetical protein